LLRRTLKNSDDSFQHNLLLGKHLWLGKKSRGKEMDRGIENKKLSLALW
jgi:hypothetical protein